MSESAGHYDVAPQFPLVSFRNEDPAIVRESARERSLVKFSRRPIVVTMGVFAIERIEAAREMDRPGGGVRKQFDKRCGRCPGRSIHGPAAVRAAAAGKKGRAKTERNSDSQTAGYSKHEVTSSRPYFASTINRKLAGVS